MKIIGMIKIIGQIYLLSLSLLAFYFALISAIDVSNINGLELLQNLANTTPWIVLFSLTLMSWKRLILSAYLITLFGAITLYFCTSADWAFPIVIFLSATIPATGLVLLFCGQLTKKLSV